MKYTYILLLAMVAFLNSALFAAPPAQPVSARSRSIGNHYLNAPLGFEFNRGQADATIAFVSHGGGYTLLLSRREIILRLNHFSAPLPKV